MSQNTANPASRGTLIAFILVTVAVLFGAGLLLTTRPEPVQIVVNPPVPTPTLPASATPGPLLIYVTGAVANPGQTFTLPRGSRVQAAVDAAGGALPNADMERVNIAGILQDGDQVHVYAQGEPDDAVELATQSGPLIVYVNTATSEELQQLPGIGPTRADAIIAYRTENGPFTDIAQLENVSGIGPGILADITPFISLE